MSEDANGLINRHKVDLFTTQASLKHFLGDQYNVDVGVVYG